MSSAIIFYPGAINRLVNSPDGPVARELARRAVQVDRRAKQLAPVDTGRLRSSISWRLGSDGKGLFALVGTDVHYAPYVELGTSRMAAQPFLRPALEAAKK